MAELINKQLIDSETIKEQSVKRAESAKTISGSGTSTIDEVGNAWFAGNVLVGGNKEPLVTQTYVDSLVGDVSAALDELHEYVEDLVNDIITFNIDGSNDGWSVITFKAKRDMTWRQFAESEYNTANMEVDNVDHGTGEYFVWYNDYLVLYDENLSRVVTPDDTIVAGRVYTVTT